MEERLAYGVAGLQLPLASELSHTDWWEPYPVATGYPAEAVCDTPADFPPTALGALAAPHRLGPTQLWSLLWLGGLNPWPLLTRSEVRGFSAGQTLGRGGARAGLAAPEIAACLLGAFDHLTFTLNSVLFVL